MNTLNNKAICENEIHLPLNVTYQTDPIIKKNLDKQQSQYIGNIFETDVKRQTNHFLLSDLTMSNTVNVLSETGTVYPIASTCVPPRFVVRFVLLIYWCFVFCFGCLWSVFCASCCLCLWSFYSWFVLQFSQTFILKEYWLRIDAWHNIVAYIYICQLRNLILTLFWLNFEA